MSFMSEVESTYPNPKHSEPRYIRNCRAAFSAMKSSTDNISMLP